MLCLVGHEEARLGNLVLTRPPMERRRQTGPVAPCSRCASPFIAPRPQHAHRFAVMLFSRAQATVHSISAQSRGFEIGVPFPLRSARSL